MNNNNLETNCTFSDFEIVKFDQSRFLVPYRLKFKQNGHLRIWDGMKSHASVSCLIYNKDRRALVLVRQFRPVVYINKLLEAQQANETLSDEYRTGQKFDWTLLNPAEGITYELCAGICDKDNSLEETVQEEILEECGYKVDERNIHKIADTRLGVGVLGALHTIFYAEVTDSMRVSQGGGNVDEGEFIEVYELAEDNVRHFMKDPSNQNPPGLMFALVWFLYEKDLYFLDRKN